MLSQTSSMNNDVVVNEAPSDSISSLEFSPIYTPQNTTYLAATSWDKGVYVWEVTSTAQTRGVVKYEHTQPALCCAWSQDGSKLFSGGCDNTVQMRDLNGNATQQIGQHNGPVSCVKYLPQHNLIMTAGWDKSVNYWDGRQPKAALSLQLEERVSAMDVHDKLAVVAQADRKILVYDLNSPQTAFRIRISTLKYQTRCIACFPTTQNMGFAVGSIEGRVAIMHVSEADEKSDFAFRCHRVTEKVNGRERQKLHPVNSIVFNKQTGAFATAGGDGTVQFWDKENKQRLSQIPQVPLPVVDTTLCNNGSIFAYAQSYGWAKGYQAYDSNTMKPKIMLKAITDEMRPKKGPGIRR